MAEEARKEGWQRLGNLKKSIGPADSVPGLC